MQVHPGILVTGQQPDEQRKHQPQSNYATSGTAQGMVFGVVAGIPLARTVAAARRPAVPGG